MTQQQTTMSRLLTFKGSQSLNGSLTDYSGSVPLRAVVKRDAYDNQSYGLAQAWSENGWVDIQRFPIDQLSISGFSYVARGDEWEAFAVRDLDRLMTYAQNHIANYREAN